MLYQAVTGYRMLHSKVVNPGGLTQPPGQRVPETPIHAAEAGATETLCGRTEFEVADRPWPPSGSLGHCGVCGSEAKARGD